ncbi:hydantoinase/oxoprolinase N-terminal domain-containing protein [Streptomyces sp. NPDC001787]|uniref:hydantoinase/oxoprolinase N-terminal domain-containing protein n=1 Tax=Streptomyces sp. NPDC001787 TaxID=3154523 RepID=UPI003319A572
MIVGVDVGPTSTDAVLLGERGRTGGIGSGGVGSGGVGTGNGSNGTGGVPGSGAGHDSTGAGRDLVAVAVAKVPSVPDDAVASIIAAVGALPAGPRGRAVQLAVGLRAAARAVNERRGLAKVGVLRIGGAAADAVRPLFGWPSDLRDAVCAGYSNVDGGSVLGPHGGMPLDREAVARFGARLAGRAEAFAVCGIFSPADAGQEREAAEILQAEAGPSVPVLLSGEVGTLGLLERENATVLYAALRDLVVRIADELTAALPLLGLAPGASVLVTRHDGTLMSLDYLRRYPGLSLGSGPACTLRGAGLLAGVSEAVVADIGGRRARVGVLTGGYPREAGAGERIGGVPVSIRIPDLLTVALPPVGAPRQGLPPEPGAGPDPGPLPPARSAAHRELAEAVDRMQPAAGRLPVLLVGGGAGTVPATALAGFDVVRPEHGGVAGAFGAAASPVGGHHERVVPPGPGLPTRLAAARDEVRELARASAVRAGADPRRVRTALEPDISVPYLPGATLLRARAAGPPLPL